MSEGDEKFDGLFLTVAQQSQGIEPLLDNLFSFLRRKTDFFVGATSQQIEDVVMKIIKKHSAISEKAEQDKKKAKEKEEKLKKQKLEQEKKKKEEEARKAQKATIATSDDDVLELDENGVFDTAKAVDPIEKVSTSKAEKVIESQPIDMSIDSDTVPDDVDRDEQSKKEAEEDKEPAPVGNGGKTDKYVWTQTLSEVTMNIPMPPGTKTKNMDVTLTNTKLKVGLKGQPPIVDGLFHKRIIVDDSVWTLEDGDMVLNMQKDNKMEWWKCAMVGDPEINTQKVQPENSKLSDLDGETRQTVEKMMFDQRQKALGLPTADELQKKEMLDKFMKAHPEMDFSKAKFS